MTSCMWRAVPDHTTPMRRLLTDSLPGVLERGPLGVGLGDRRNRIGVDLDVDFMGEHFDDLTAAIGGVVPESTTLDTRIWLAIRDAELFFAVDNVLDADRMEVLGTVRRYRQFRFGLTWDFFN